MYLFLALLALVIALPYVARWMGKISNRSHPRTKQAENQSDLGFLDFGDSGASHHAGHDCGSHDGGFDGGCDAGGHH